MGVARQDLKQGPGAWAVRDPATEVVMWPTTLLFDQAKH